MKAIISFLFLSLCTITLEGQTTDLKTHNIVKDSIVAKFNRQDFKGIYDMADSSFKAAVSEKDLVEFLKSYAILGKVKNNSLLKQDKGDNILYRLQCARKSMALTLGVTNAKSFTNFGLDLYRLPAERTRTNFASNNPMQTSLDSAVQKAVTGYMNNKNVSGISVGVIKEGNMYSYHFGEVKKGTNQLPTNNTIYALGSIAKTFTGILLANAVIENKIKLDDDIRMYLDGVYPNLQYNNAAIRLVNLANQTSRLPSMPSIPNSFQSPWDESFSAKITKQNLNDILKTIVLDTLPGTKREYSNFAVCLLGKILEKVYKMPYEQILKKYISMPYQMNNTTILLSKAQQKIYAQGYSPDGTEVPNLSNSFIGPAGGIRSTIADMLLYMKEQMNTNNKAAALSHQLTSGTEKNGKGLLWGINRTKANYLLWSHDGSTDGFSSLIYILPELNAGIILLTNNGNYFDESFNSDIFITIYKYLIAKQ